MRDEIKKLNKDLALLNIVDRSLEDNIIFAEKVVKYFNNDDKALSIALRVDIMLLQDEDCGYTQNVQLAYIDKTKNILDRLIHEKIELFKRQLAQENKPSQLHLHPCQPQYGSSGGSYGTCQPYKPC